MNVNGLLTGPLDTPENFVVFSGAVGSHELGHLLGLRHGNAMGPIGSGISPVPGNALYSPPFPGPATALETTDHVMTSPETGETPDEFVEEKFLGLRSAIKLAFNEQGVVVDETAAPNDTSATAMPIAFERVFVPNTLESGQHFGHVVEVEALAVRGRIDVTGESDYYAFAAQQGDLFNFEVLSHTLAHRLGAVDTFLKIEDSQGGFVFYHASPDASNSDDFDSLDPILIDLEIPADDVYRVVVQGQDLGPGDYELFGYRFESLPEPGRDAVLWLGLALAAALARRGA